MTTVSQLISEQANTNMNRNTWGSLIYNVNAYGAVGNGDETAEIQNAINTAIADGVKGIAFPHGNYVASSLTGLDQVVLFGDNATLTVGGSSVPITQLGIAPLSDLSRKSINGNFDIWQRGTSFTNLPHANFLADRWQLVIANSGTLPANIVHSKQALLSGDIQGSYYFYRIAPDGSGSGFGANDEYRLQQKIENGTRYLAGGNKQKVTVSFWARSSNPNKKIGIKLIQSYGSGGTPSASETINGKEWTLTSTWKKYSYTFTTNTLVGKTFGTNNDEFLALHVGYMWGSSAAIQYGDTVAESFVGAGNIDIAQVQVNAGDQALPFQPRSFAEELALCQRYYEKSYDYNVRPGTVTNVGFNLIGIASHTDNVTCNISYKVPKRTTPSVAYYHTDGTAGAVGKTISFTKVTGVTTIINSPNGVGQINSPGGFALGDVVQAHWIADAEL